MRYVNKFLILLAIFTGLSIPAIAEEQNESLIKPYLGTWKGEMKQRNMKFPVAIQIQQFIPGKWAGEILHEGSSWGKLLAININETEMSLSASIVDGRQLTLDGLTVLRIVDQDTISRNWINPGTGKGEAVGLLKRVDLKDSSEAMQRSKAKPTAYRYPRDIEAPYFPRYNNGSSRPGIGSSENAAREAAQDAIRDYQNTLRSRGIPVR